MYSCLVFFFNFTFQSSKCLEYMLRDRCDDSTRGEKEIRLEKLKEVREADLYPDNFYIISEMP